MLYPIYASAVIVGLSAAMFFATLSETREFIGEKGVEYCWMYGSFERYFYINLSWIFADIGFLLILYWLARRSCLAVSLVVWVVWLLGEPLLSFFDMSYC